MKTIQEIQKHQKTVTLFELNQRPGQIFREVHFSRQPVTVTDYGKTIAEIRPMRLSLERKERAAK